jgi:hypothetical protein
MTVNWSRLTTAHGSAEHVPRALADLVSLDPDQRQRGYWELDNHVVLQGDLYEAAPFVALALIEILRDRTQPGRNLIYRLLWEIRNGAAAETEMVTLPDGRRMSLMLAARVVVAEGLPHYVGDVLAPDPQLRREALQLVTSLHERKKDVAELLSSARQHSTEPAIRSDLEQATRELFEC